ncbi:putative fructose-bisphosphate aldolase [Peptococcaceae bacterium CEB3]|nr:putative fructose-bisphosphate aldolase [Peptococcaceae bacterium CEB3]
MPFAPLRPLPETTRQYGFAQGAFNVNSVVQPQAVTEVHEMFRSAAILQGAHLASAFMGGNADFVHETVQDRRRRGAKRIGTAKAELAKGPPTPTVYHLDHGKDLESLKAAIDGGYISAMIDSSLLGFSENVELTWEVVQYAHSHGISEGGELGVLCGIEGDVFSEHSTCTNPLKAVELFQKTDEDYLVISYRTKHGIIRRDRLSKKEAASGV